MSEPYWEPLAAAPASGAPSGAAGGDLAGTYPNPTIGVNKVVDAHTAPGVGGTDAAGGAFPTTGLFGGYRVTQYSWDFWRGAYCTNDYQYFPALEAARPWHWVGGQAHKRLYPDLYGGAQGVWTWNGGVWDAPFNCDVGVVVQWREVNGSGESNGVIGLGINTGGIPFQQTTYDTAAARQFVSWRVQPFQITAGESWGIWTANYDAGNPCHVYDVWCEITPLRAWN